MSSAYPAFLQPLNTHQFQKKSIRSWVDLINYYGWQNLCVPKPYQAVFVSLDPNSFYHVRGQQGTPVRCSFMIAYLEHTLSKHNAHILPIMHKHCLLAFVKGDIPTEFYNIASKNTLETIKLTSGALHLAAHPLPRR